MKENKNWKKQIALFLISQNLSMFGSSVVGFSIVWYITVTTESGFWITLSTLATLIPQVLVSLWAGVFADRYNKKTIIMLADGFTALATLLAFVAFHYGFANLSFLIFIACLRSVGGGFQAPAVNALYPEIVPREHLLRINGINQMANNVLLLLSPAAGGAILGMFGMQWTFLVDLLTAVIAIAIMFRLKIVTRAADRSDSSVLKELREGVRYTWSQPLLRVMLVCYAVTFVLITPAAFLSPLMVVRSFGSEVWKLTANEMLWSLGALLGGAFVAWKGEFKNKITMIAVSLAVFGCTFALMGLSRVFWVYLIFDCICGMFVPVAFDELVARLRVLLRRSNGQVSNVLQCGGLEMDLNSRRVSRDGRELQLSAKEFAVLEYLLRNQGVVLARETIENHVWDYDFEGGSNVVDVYIRYLRKKVDDGFEKKLIQTVRGAGYVLKETL